MRFLRATTPLRDGDAKRTRRSRHARRPKDALRHVRTPFRAEAARLEVDVARSARNAARFADRDRRYRLFGFLILAAVYFSCRARHASRAPDRARRAPLTSYRALRPSPCSGDTVERRGRARGGRRHPRGARDRAVRGSRIVLGTFRFFDTGRACPLFTTPRYPPLRDRRERRARRFRCASRSRGTPPHSNSPSRFENARVRLGVHYSPR